jgi:hypothetical protein
MPIALNVLLQMGAPWTRTLRPLHFGQVADRLVGEDVARAAARVADQHHVAFRVDLVGDRLQRVGVDHLVPVVEIAEQERRVDEWRRLRERRHVRRRHNAVIDRDALVHVREVVLLEAELAVLVQHEVDGLAVVLDHELLELDERAREYVVVRELHCAVQRDRLLRARVEGNRERDRGDATHHCAKEISHEALLRDSSPLAAAHWIPAACGEHTRGQVVRPI